MKKELLKKISALDPKFRKEITDLFSHINECVSVLYEAATTDEKTGLYNTKFFNNLLEMELEKAKRGKQKLSLVITDIDFFKKVNDTYGHVKADTFLGRLAKVILKQIRKSDIAARFGGEEFVILLPETSLPKAKKFCARLKKAIHTDAMLNKYHITVSGGIAECKNHETKKTFLARADKALYKAKHTGRDKFVA